MTGKKKKKDSSPSTLSSLTAAPANVPWSREDNHLLQSQGFHNFEKIGYGAFATVYRADRYDKRNGQTNPVAIKFINLDNKSKNYRERLFPREYQATITLKHSNIVPVKKILMSKDKSKVWIVMELERSDLLQELEKVNRIKEDKGREWVKQMMQGLKYMHSKNWAHRDLKVENVLIGYDDRALLSDFGFSRTQDTDSLSGTHLGSMQYSAPEVLEMNKGSKGGLYDAFKADVWGLGIIMFVMFVGFLPVNGETEAKIRAQQDKINKVIDILPPDRRMSRELTDLVKKMLTIDPEKRISLDDALRHPWITGGSLHQSATSSDKSQKSKSKKPNELSLVVPASGAPPNSSQLSDFSLNAKIHEPIRVQGYARSTVPSTPGTDATSRTGQQEEGTPVPSLRQRRRRRKRRTKLLLLLCFLVFIIVALVVVVAVIVFRG